MNIPNEVPENGLEPDVRRALNALIRYIRETQPRDSSTVAVHRTTSGTHIEVKESARGSGRNQVPRWG